MPDGKATFHQMVDALGASKAPLSVRLDVSYSPSGEEVQTARRVIGHVMADADVRGRLASLKVEPLVRAGSVVLEDIRSGKTPRAQREVAESLCEYLDVLDRAFGAVPSVLNNRGVARSFAGDFAGAAADLSSARRMAPGFEAARVNEIAVLRKQGDHAHLEKVAHEIEAADPGNAEALRALIDAKLALGRDRGEAFALGVRLHGAKGARPHDVLKVGALAADAGMNAEAESYLREYIALEPKATEGHVRLATALLSQGKFEGALAEYEALTELDGPKHEYLLAMALIHDQIGNISDAASAFDFALEHASASDQETIEQAFSEFRERRGISKDGTPVAPKEQPPATAVAQAPAPLPGPFVKEEEDLAPASGAPEDEPDLDSDEFKPRTVGEAELFGIPSKEVDVFKAQRREPVLPGPEREPDVPAPPPESPAPAPAVMPEPSAVAPPGPIEEPLSTEERIVQALSASTTEAEAGDDIMGEPLAPAPPPTRPELEPRPVRAPEPHEHQEPEDAPHEDESIVVAQPEAIVFVKEEVPEPSIAPTVTSAARAPLESRPAPAAQRSGPVVSAPPPMPDAPDEDLLAELDALSSSDSPAKEEPPLEPEPFRRPTFDVDEFMAALEAKAKPVFDHLYDGLLEQRRKEGPATPATASLYESAPPTELPSVQAPPGSAAKGEAQGAEPAPSFNATPAPPSPVETAAPVMPALLRDSANKAIRTSKPEGTAPDPTAFTRAVKLASAGDDTGAEQAIDAFLRGAPDSAPGWNLKGDLRERAGDESAAVAAYLQAVKYDAGLKEAWNNLGVLLHVLGRFEEALQALESAVAAHPEDRHLWHNLGSTYHEVGRLKDALEAFNRAIKIDPNDKVSHNNRGTTLFELGDYAGARESFEKAASIDPAFEQAHNNLGRALEKLEDKEGAVRSFETALAVNTGSRTALRNLARVLRALGRVGDAAAAESRLSALGT